MFFVVIQTFITYTLIPRLQDKKFRKADTLLLCQVFISKNKEQWGNSVGCLMYFSVSATRSLLPHFIGVSKALTPAQDPICGFGVKETGLSTESFTLRGRIVSVECFRNHRPYGHIYSTVKKMLGLIPYDKSHLSVWKWMDYLIETHEAIFHLVPDCCSLEHLYTLFHCMVWTGYKAPKCCRYTGVTEFTKPDCEVLLTIGRFSQMLVVQAKIL